jgi:hypothetical protein
MSDRPFGKIGNVEIESSQVRQLRLTLHWRPVLRQGPARGRSRRGPSRHPTSNRVGSPLASPPAETAPTRGDESRGPLPSHGGHRNGDGGPTGAPTEGQPNLEPATKIVSLSAAMWLFRNLKTAKRRYSSRRKSAAPQTLNRSVGPRHQKPRAQTRNRK